MGSCKLSSQFVAISLSFLSSRCLDDKKCNDVATIREKTAFSPNYKNLQAVVRIGNTPPGVSHINLTGEHDSGSIGRRGGGHLPSRSRASRAGFFPFPSSFDACHAG